MIILPLKSTSIYFVVYERSEMKDTWETSYILASEDWKVLANETSS